MPSPPPLEITVPSEHSLYRLWNLWGEERRQTSALHFPLFPSQQEPGAPIAPERFEEEMAVLHQALTEFADERWKRFLEQTVSGHFPPDLDEGTFLYLSSDGMAACPVG